MCIREDVCELLFAPIMEKSTDGGAAVCDKGVSIKHVPAPASGPNTSRQRLNHNVNHRVVSIRLCCS